MIRMTVAHRGARMYYGVAQAAQACSVLNKFFTDLTVNKGLPKFISRFKVSSSLKRLSNRHVPNVPSEKIVHQRWYGLSSRIYGKSTNVKDHFRNFLNYSDEFEKDLVQKAFHGSNVLLMVSAPSKGRAIATAKSMGILTIKEQIMGGYGSFLNILRKEFDEYGQWEERKLDYSTYSMLNTLEGQEWANCEYIICGSDFVSNTLIENGCSSKKIKVIPYGVPIEGKSEVKTYDPKRKLRVLFVGHVGLRKGIHHLLMASEQMKDSCEFRICGPIDLKNEVISRYAKAVDFEGVVNRSEINSFYEWADVMVFPSLFEGSATVGYEAIMNNLPLITTLNSGIPISNGQEGMIIETSSSEAIVGALEKILQKPDLINQMSIHTQKLHHFASYEGYQERLCKFFKEVNKVHF